MCGLENGNFFGWDLGSNNEFESNDVPENERSKITSLSKFGTFILSGDMIGTIQVRDSSNNF